MKILLNATFPTNGSTFYPYHDYEVFPVSFINLYKAAIKYLSNDVVVILYKYYIRCRVIFNMYTSRKTLSPKAQSVYIHVK